MYQWGFCQTKINELQQYQQQNMKHINIDAILSKRRASKSSAVKHKDQKSIPNQSVSQSRQIDNNIIQHIIELTKNNTSLNHESKLDILQLISNKTGIMLNKSLVLPYISAIFYPEYRQISSRVKKGQSFFLLGGQVREYTLTQTVSTGLKFNTQPPLNRTKSNESDKDDQAYYTLREFEVNNPSFAFNREFDQLSGFGKIFKEKSEKYASSKILAYNATLVLFREIERDSQFIYSDGLSQDQKMQLVSYFPVLRLLGKKLINFVNNFRLKHFNFKDLVYKKGESPCSVYFVIEGEVSFQLLLESEEDRKQPTITTSSITAHNYFGEEEILFKGTTRSHTAKVITSKCIVLELSRQKFQKLLEYSEFYELVSKTAKMKQLERQKNIAKAKNILMKQTLNQSTQLPQLTDEDLKATTVNFKQENKRRFSTFKAPTQKVKVMHGNIIREIPQVHSKIEFSMLRVNPDHYAATKDKYRQYFVKPSIPEEKKPRNFKKLWKLLNLEDILSQNDIDITSTEGRKVFDSYRRLQNQVLEAKSVRPKTTSSNYRTKMQYIAYLQQFNS